MTSISLSKTTVAACTNAAQSLRHLKLSSEEKGILEQVQDFTTVESLIEHYVQEIGKRKNHSKMWRKVYAFTQFAGPVLEIFKQANLSPECSIALGLVGLLLIQVRSSKKDPEKL